MEGIIGYIAIGVLIGLVVILWLTNVDQKVKRDKKLNWLKSENRLQKQCDEILKELALKKPEKTITKTKAVQLLYQFAASKNNFTLKDIEQIIKTLQNHYKDNIENNAVYKMNFPEKEQLNFKPQETLYLLKIFNESIHNAAIHAQADFVFNIASIEDGKLNIITHDNGIGYDLKLIPDGQGIEKIKNAVDQLEGNLKLTSTLGNGTVLNIEVPSKPFER